MTSIAQCQMLLDAVPLRCEVGGTLCLAGGSERYHLYVDLRLFATQTEKRNKA